MERYSTAGRVIPRGANRRLYCALCVLVWQMMVAMWTRTQIQIVRTMRAVIAVYRHIEALELFTSLHAIAWAVWFTFVGTDAETMPTYAAAKRLWPIGAWAALAIIASAGQLLGLNRKWKTIRYLSAIIACFFWVSAAYAFLTTGIYPFALPMAIINALACFWIMVVPREAVQSTRSNRE